MINSKHFNIFLLAFFGFGSNVHCNNNVKTDILRQTKFPQCKACRVFVNSFEKGMENTAKGKFEGGDAAWEEEKLGSYSRSEVRLVEIQENVCSNIVEGRDQCYSFNEQHDSVIEDWWFEKQESEPSLFKYLCIEHLKLCCPDLHYGPDCLPCPGFPDNICNNNGKCKGMGTRKGNGKCSCDSAYDGEFCDTCSKTHYESYKDDSKLLCSKCHISCKDSCTKGGPTGCDSCAPGWISDKEKGCLDLNECVDVKSICASSQFCVNTEGSYKCLECDHACAGCTGDGPDMCITCANGFNLHNNVCVDSEQEQRKQHVFITRYLTYLGLCIATCIILQRNVMLAAIIGLCVGIYISISEYMLNTPAIPNVTDFVKSIRLNN
ncbi:hypothetical protein FQR65_LT13559 [Abscondita terminalis]|nr:hypothetical protein FQR65_LT13559 [Abscondita terminalis]